MLINLPEEVVYIINSLHNTGYEASAVGGCVRDSLLGKEPEDWDIATNAVPEDVIRLFKDVKVLPTGLKHGTVTLMINGNPYEVTTYRIDGKYTNGRRPDSVDFTQSIREDLKRRDFTINAMAYNGKQGLIDLFGGQQDIKNKLIRCVGDANTRFSEDALRMLRAVRFSAQLGFEIELKTKNAIMENAELLNKISRERVRDELVKILVSDYPGRVRDLVDLGLMNHIIPELVKCKGVTQENPYHIYTVDEHTYKVVEYIENEILLRLAALLHDIGKPQCKTIDEYKIAHFYGHNEASAKMANNILCDLKFDNSTINTVVKLIANHDMTIGESGKSIRKWLNKLGKQDFERLLKLKKADILAKNPIYYQERYNKLANIKEAYKNTILNGHCYSISDLAIDGNDLKALGFKEGKELGRVLKELLNLVIESPEFNTKEKLIEHVKSVYKGGV